MTQQQLPPMPLTPTTHMPIRFRVTYGSKGKIMPEHDTVPRYPGDVFEVPSTSTVGDLFYQLYIRNPTDPGHEWSLASPVDRLIYRFPCKNITPITEAFPFPLYYNKKGEIEIVADQDHLLTESATIMRDYDFMISLIKKLPIPHAEEQRKRVISCLAKVVTGIINRIRYRSDLPQFCFPGCVHQVEFNKLRIYANSVADGSIFGLNNCPLLEDKPNTITSTEEDDDEEENRRRHKRARREVFPIEQLPAEIIAHILTFAGPKELCNFEQTSVAWEWRVKQGSLWTKFCNGWKLRNEDEGPLDDKEVVKTVFEIQACRRHKHKLVAY